MTRSSCAASSPAPAASPRMRSALLAAAVLAPAAGWAVLLGGATAPARASSAAPLPSASASAPEASTPGTPRTLCRITDPRIDESSGVAVLPDGSLVTHNDSGDRARYFVLDRGCEVVSERRLTGVDAFDWEDVSTGPLADGTPALWFADTGDNAGTRRKPTLVSVALPDPTESGRRTDEAEVYPVVYPTPGVDVEALLVDPLGRGVVLVTKSPLGQGSVLVADGAPVPGEPVTLREVTRLSLAPSGTPGGPVTGLAALGAQVAVTAGDFGPAGDRLVLRTYTDALTWSVDPTVPDLAEAVTQALQRPAVSVPLPETTQGEGIAYDAGGADWVTTTEGLDSPVQLVPVPTELPGPSPSATASTPPPAAPPGAAGDGLAGPGLPAASSFVTAGLLVLAGAAVVTVLLARLIGRRRLPRVTAPPGSRRH